VTVRLMSDGELSRLEVLRDLDRKRLTTKAAAQLLGLELLQFSRHRPTPWRRLGSSQCPPSDAHSRPECELAHTTDDSPSAKLLCGR
jgi:hypothetical protein